MPLSIYIIKYIYCKPCPETEVSDVYDTNQEDEDDTWSDCEDNQQWKQEQLQRLKRCKNPFEEDEGKNRFQIEN